MKKNPTVILSLLIVALSVALIYVLVINKIRYDTYIIDTGNFCSKGASTLAISKENQVFSVKVNVANEEKFVKFIRDRSPGICYSK